MLTRPRYVLAVPDLARSAAYCRDVLGFTVHGMGEPGWRWLEFSDRTLDGQRMMSGQPTA